MRKIYFNFIVLSVCVFALSSVYAQTMPPKDSVLAKMVLANKYFMDKWPDPAKDIVTDKTRPSNLWTRAAYYEGLMALYFTSLDQQYFDYAYDWAESHDWAPTYGSVNTRDGDHQCCGQTYIELYQLKPENTAWIEPITECMDLMVNSTKIDDWSWVDAMQMAMPIFAKLGVVHKDTAYFHKMHQMYAYTRNQHGTNGLYNTEEHLWYRDADFDPPFATTNGKSCYWSRGNGWVISALVRVLDVIPDTLEYRNEYETTLKEMAGALAAVQREDGFWNASLFDPGHYGGKETSGTGFLTYGLAWGINNGVLDSATYLPIVTKAWNGMVNDALHSDGFLGYVQSTGKQPSDGYPFTYNKASNFEDYGLGALLLAGAEMYKLARDTAYVVAETEEEMPVEETPEEIETAISGAETLEVFDAKLYPNPAGETAYLSVVSEVQAELNIRISNLVGVTVDEQNQKLTAGENSLEIDLQSLGKGMYLVTLKVGINQKVIKLLKVR